MTKPPAQVMGVAGIAPTPVTMNEPTDWATLVHLPPFQMFAEESVRPDRSAANYSAEEHATNFIRQGGGGRDLYDRYAEWHEKKGYWPAETPMGGLKNA